MLNQQLLPCNGEQGFSKIKKFNQQRWISLELEITSNDHICRYCSMRLLTQILRFSTPTGIRYERIKSKPSNTKIHACCNAGNSPDYGYYTITYGTTALHTSLGLPVLSDTWVLCHSAALLRNRATHWTTGTGARSVIPVQRHVYTR